MGGLNLKEHGKLFRKAEEDDKMFKFDCGSACEDRTHIVGECPLYGKEREMCVIEFGKIDGCDREAFECWDYEKKAIAVLGERKWSEHSRVEVDRVGKIFLRRI